MPYLALLVALLACVAAGPSDVRHVFAGDGFRLIVHADGTGELTEDGQTRTVAAAVTPTGIDVDGRSFDVDATGDTVTLTGHGVRAVRLPGVPSSKSPALRGSFTLLDGTPIGFDEGTLRLAGEDVGTYRFDGHALTMTVTGGDTIEKTVYLIPRRDTDPPSYLLVVDGQPLDGRFENFVPVPLAPPAAPPAANPLAGRDAAPAVGGRRLVRAYTGELDGGYLDLLLYDDGTAERVTRMTPRQRMGLNGPRWETPNGGPRDFTRWQDDGRTLTLGSADATIRYDLGQTLRRSDAGNGEWLVAASPLPAGASGEAWKKRAASHQSPAAGNDPAVRGTATSTETIRLDGGRFEMTYDAARFVNVAGSRRLDEQPTDPGDALPAGDDATVTSGSLRRVVGTFAVDGYELILTPDDGSPPIVRTVYLKPGGELVIDRQAWSGSLTR